MYNIILVDDDTISLNFMSMMLKKHSDVYNITSFDSPLSLLEHLNGLPETNPLFQTIDLIITDINMPEMNGFDLVKAIRKIRALELVPIIAMSADKNKGYLKQAFDEGATDYIRKPLDAIEVSTRVGTAIELKKQTQQRKIHEENNYRDMQIAQAIHYSISPVNIFQAQIDIMGYYHSYRELGGDLSHWVQLSGQKYGIILLDVMGHGISTAFLSMYIRPLLSQLTDEVGSLARTFEAIHESLMTFNRKSILDINYHATGIGVVVDFREQTIQYINAGHPAAYMAHKNGQSDLLSSHTQPLGILESSVYEEMVYKMTPEDQFTLYLYTDGLMDIQKEGVSDPVYKQLRERQIDGPLLEKAVTYIESAKFDDDATVVQIEVRNSPLMP